MNGAALSAAIAVAWAVLFLGAVLVLAYRRAGLAASSVVLGALLLAYWILGAAPDGWKAAVSIPYALLLLLNVRPLRLRFVTRPFLRSYRRLLPSMSATEREALDAGTVWWDGELFTGGPDWQKLMSAKVPALIAAEQAFLDGPCEDLCAMLDDWDITHVRADLPPEVWSFIKAGGFFGMIIPRRYGGLEFSAYAHSCVLIKIASRSGTASSTIAVPNSLGPAELLLHYGTDAQKDHYLPRLARGEEIPCFALTGPRAGSDAASIPDTGVICNGTWQGAEILGIRLNSSGWPFVYSIPTGSWGTKRISASPVH
jgi:acyl-CoA dehydrogenase